jgi:molecular chaperone GrpE
MTDNTDPKPEDIELPPGMGEVTGPAAFKARQAAAAAAIVANEVENSQDTPPADAGPLLLEKVKTLEAAVAQNNDQLLRTVAEMENLRKRFQREREDATKFAISGFAKDLLDVADTFRRALDAIPADLRDDEKIKPLVEGIEATERNLLKSFEKNGIKKIEPLDEPFNPNFHEVMFEGPAAGKAAGTIIQVIEVGYVLNDRLLRAAKVGVAKGDGAEGPVHHVDTQA